MATKKKITEPEKQVTNPVEKALKVEVHVGHQCVIAHSACMYLAQCDGNIVCAATDNKG